jgi:imidazole glycerol phosphate synthase glutamine amidotransferase subunit
MKTVIIKYNAGNVQSVMYALDRIGASYLYTDDEAEIRSADKVIFPGVGEASTTMSYLRNVGLDKVIPSLKQPVFGTCVGMQLMCRFSEENNTECMGIFDVDVKRFPASPGLKVPHMGWNNISGYQNRSLRAFPTMRTSTSSTVMRHRYANTPSPAAITHCHSARCCIRTTSMRPSSTARSAGTPASRSSKTFLNFNNRLPRIHDPDYTRYRPD